MNPLFARPNRGLSAFVDDEALWVAADPVATLRVEAGDEEALRRLPQRVDAFLEHWPYGLAAGLISYEAGELLQGVKRTRPARVPAAVVHIYSHPPVRTELPMDQAPPSGSREDNTDRTTQGFREEWSRSGYMTALAAIRAYLENGDCYQVNLARRFAAAATRDPREIWLALLAAHPAPHGCYVDWGEGRVFGASPERFLRIHGRDALTEPIKGSRPRGATPEQDRELARALCQSDKDRAENLMIVDLLRNDLGRICDPGTVVADPLFALHKFSNVQHLVSTVRGQLRQEIRPLEALLACSPGGSITGAPKRRAMEIIAELEPAPRDFYCGSFFRQDPAGNLDSSILIRTLQQHDGHLYCHGGGGIVHDSNPEEEYREGLFKVDRLMRSVASG